jgi:hypothetical protein
LSAKAARFAWHAVCCSVKQMDDHTWLEQNTHRIEMAGRAGELPVFEGRHRIEARRAVFWLEHGLVVRSEQRLDGRETRAVLGMRLAGWVSSEREVSRGWKPGARALLWMPGRPMTALTSPTFAFLAEARHSSGVRSHALPMSPLATGSMTRVDLALAV